MELQEFCIAKQEEVLKKVEDEMNAAEANKLNKEMVEKILNEILAGFQLRQPSDFFIEVPTDDTECNGFIQIISGLQHTNRKRIFD